MKKGTLVLKTNGGERKMSYSHVNGIYYMATKSTSNKVKQINEDSQVLIDLDQTKYEAHLIGKDSEHYNQSMETYLSTMPKFQKFLYKNMFGKKNDMFIVLTTI